MERNGLRSIVTGSIIVVVGIVYLLFNMGILPIEWKSTVISWQSLLILLGIIGICRRGYVGGILFILVGAFFLLPNLSALLGLSYSAAALHSMTWPALIIIVGLLIMFRRHHHHYRYNCDHHHHSFRDHTESKDGKVDYNLMMNGIDEVFLEPVFRGGDINTIMGGAKLDLRRTSLPEGDTVLKISSICGGVTLLLPLDWNVEIHNDAILGGFADHRRGNGQYVDRRLIIEASFIFGGGSIE
jgi:predicted membrane protein